MLSSQSSGTVGEGCLARAATARGGFGCDVNALEKELQAVTGAFNGRCMWRPMRLSRANVLGVVGRDGTSRRAASGLSSGERSKRGESARNENSWRVESKGVDEYSLGKERHGTIARGKESWCGWGEPKVGSRELWDDWTARAWENGAFVGITAGQLARPEATGGRRRLRQQKAPSSTSPVPHGRCETANPKERRRAKVCRRGRGLELKVVSHWARMCTRLAVCAGYRTG